MFEFTEDQLAMRRMVRDLAQNVVAPRAAEIDEKAEFPWDIKEAFAKYDLLGLHLPAEYGGIGASNLTFCIVVEEIAKVCASSALIVADHALGSLPMIIGCSDEQKRKYFPKMASGEHLAAFALTEPNAGSDVAAIATRAVLKGDNYVLNGTKRFITGAGVAELYTVFASTDPSQRSKGLSAFIVEKDRPGFSVGKIEHKMGIRGSTTGELLFDDCIIPKENLIGKEGDGFKIAMMTLDHSRPGVAAQALGIAQGALDFATSYAMERVQFGKPIASFEGIQFMLADMAMQVESARLLLYRSADMLDKHDKEMSKFSAMAKCFCSDVAMKVTTDAVQILGGYGYISEYPVERMMRDAKITQIYEGANQIQRLVIARALMEA